VGPSQLDTFSVEAPLKSTRCMLTKMHNKSTKTSRTIIGIGHDAIDSIYYICQRKYIIQDIAEQGNR
jgi:hypothetical protein